MLVNTYGYILSSLKNFFISLINSTPLKLLCSKSSQSCLCIFKALSIKLLFLSFLTSSKTKTSEDSNNIEKTEDKTKKENELKELKKSEIKKEKTPKSLNSPEKKNNEVKIKNKQLESEKSDKKLVELDKIKRDGAILRGVPKERDKVEIKNIKILNYQDKDHES